MFEESLALKRARGNESDVAMAITNLGRVERDAGSTDRAADLFADAIAIWQRTRDRQRLSVGRYNAALVALDRGDLMAARRGLQAALVTAREFEDRPEMASILTDLARVECAAGRWERAHDALIEAWRLIGLVKIGVVVCLALESTVIWLAGTGRPLDAARMVGAADADRAGSRSSGCPRTHGCSGGDGAGQGRCRPCGLGRGGRRRRELLLDPRDRVGDRARGEARRADRGRPDRWSPGRRPDIVAPTLRHR